MAKSRICSSAPLTRHHLATVVLLVVLVLSCCCVCAYSQTTGTILSQILLQESLTEGSNIYTTLDPSSVVTVLCRTNYTLVYDDPWWLHVTYVSASGDGYNTTPFTGWVADFYVNCGTIGNCDVPLC